jgi:hypothetical protein
MCTSRQNVNYYGPQVATLIRRSGEISLELLNHSNGRPSLINPEIETQCEAIALGTYSRPRLGAGQEKNPPNTVQDTTACLSGENTGSLGREDGTGIDAIEVFEQCSEVS